MKLKIHRCAYGKLKCFFGEKEIINRGKEQFAD